MTMWTKLIGTLMLAAAVTAPVALAEHPDNQAGQRGPGAIAAASLAISTRPDDRAGLRGPGAVTSTEIATASRPDDRAGARGPGALDSSVPSLHPDDRAEARGPGAVTTLASPSGSRGFDWNDGLIGGLAGMGMTLLLAGAGFILLSRRSSGRFA